MVLAVVCIPAGMHAQASGSIAGRVSDQATQQPLVGAQITVIGTAARGTTDAQGNYRIPGVPAGQHQVSATRVGYDTRSQSVTVAAGQTATANFNLSVSAVELGGLIVTATGREQRTRELGNAVSTISTERVELAAVPNMASLIQGRSSGVTVMQSGGTTGAGARVRIRGSNSVSLSNEPLLIIDGVRANNAAESFTIGTGGQTPSRLNDINPEDIETIEILKGPAAAAMYGTAAANGVIQVTTKRGRSGRARWSAYTEQGTIIEPTNYADNVAEIGFGYCAVVEQGEGN
jgi:TonB-dependent SusC/RagA subfamily outer membrane receptor